MVKEPWYSSLEGECAARNYPRFAMRIRGRLVYLVVVLLGDVCLAGPELVARSLGLSR